MSRIITLGVVYMRVTIIQHPQEKDEHSVRFRETLLRRRGSCKDDRDVVFSQVDVNSSEEVTKRDVTEAINSLK